MKEYGGFIEWEHYNNSELYDNFIKLNSGRNCLLYLIRYYNIKHIYMPSFNCSAVFQPCEQENVKIDFYNINEEFLPVIPNSINDDSWIYVINYYGQLDNNYMSKLHKKYKNLIIDNAQAFFQMPVEDIPTLYTCRKYFGVPDGGYLYNGNDNDKMVLTTDNSIGRLSHLVGRFEESANKYYTNYLKNEEAIENLELKHMSRFTENLMKSIDYVNISKKRVRNFSKLDELLSKYNKIKCNSNTGPFMYPFYFKKADILRNKLISMKIYVPILWPNVIESMAMDTLEYDYAKNIIPLPCDQRYNVDEMAYIATTVIKLMEEIK